MGRGRRRPLQPLKPKTRGHWKFLDLITDNTGPACVNLRLRASLGLVTNSTGPILNSFKQGQGVKPNGRWGDGDLWKLCKTEG